MRQIAMGLPSNRLSARRQDDRGKIVATIMMFVAWEATMELVPNALMGSAARRLQSDG